MSIKDFLFDFFNKKGITVNENDDLFEKGHIDSLSFFRLILELEVNFDKSLDIELFSDLDKISINSIVKIVEK